MNPAAHKIEEQDETPAARPEAEPVPAWITTPAADTAEATSTAQRLRARIAEDQARRRAEREELARYSVRLAEKLAAQRQREPTLDASVSPPRRRPLRPTLPPHDVFATAPHDDFAPAPEFKDATTNSRRHTIRLALVMATSALVLGTSLGFAIAKRDSLLAMLASSKTQANAVLASLSRPLPESVPVPTISGETTISRKPVAMAALTVNDARGILGGPIPLALEARPMSDGAAVDVLISGLPPAAYLSAGEASGTGKWRLKPSDMAGLKLVVPASTTPTLDLEVKAIAQGTDDLAAPAQKLRVDLAGVTIAPAAAPPDQPGSNVVVQPAPAPKGADLVAKADGLLKQGDILSARQIYLQAAAQGNAMAMAGVGKTFDPKTFASLKISGLQPDQAKADEWYKKAKAGGVVLN